MLEKWYAWVYLLSKAWYPSSQFHLKTSPKKVINLISGGFWIPLCFARYHCNYFMENILNNQKFLNWGKTYHTYFDFSRYLYSIIYMILILLGFHFLKSRQIFILYIFMITTNDRSILDRSNSFETLEWKNHICVLSRSMVESFF